MRSITPELTKELSKHFKDSTKVASTSPYKVKTFRELVEHTAKLSFTNKDYLLFYRGQAEDYLNKAGASTYYPSIYRGDPLLARELIYRFDILEGSSKALVELFETRQVEGYKELKRRRAIQWSILQHYEVCSTPYLDFTQSLRVACSFATLDNKRDTACISVFGLPYMTNRISNNS
ncbi:MAG TPA: FRG domain-containing protein, partial [Flavitalea sp.]|nr:FRG domain-containing protein [Flavitalea sp.]